MPDILIRVPDSIRCCGLCPCFYAEHPMHCQADAHKPKRTHGAPYSGKPDWCPAKELPAHGDLIDKNELRKWSYEVKTNRGKYQRVINVVNIPDLPVIVLASEEVADENP